METFSELSVRVTPRSSRNQVTHDQGIVKVWVNAPPVDGAANDAVIALVAKTLRIAPSKVSVVRGEASREKVLRFLGLTPEALADRLASI